jgi:hypothetical protein
MKDLQQVATKCMLVGILVGGYAFAQDIKAQREGCPTDTDGRRL